MLCLVILKRISGFIEKDENDAFVADVRASKAVRAQMTPNIKNDQTQDDRPSYKESFCTFGFVINIANLVYETKNHFLLFRTIGSRDF